LEGQALLVPRAVAATVTPALVMNLQPSFPCQAKWARVVDERRLSTPPEQSPGVFGSEPDNPYLDPIGDTFLDLIGDTYFPHRLAHTSTTGARQRKLESSERTNELVLAPTTTNAINLDTLTDDHPGLVEVLAPIRDPAAFLDLFLDGAAAPPRRRPLSRGMLRHEPDLKRFQIVEDYVPELSVPATHAVMVAALWCVLFLTPKKTAGEGRLVIDARPVNRLQRKPGPMGLPKLHDLITHVLSFSHAAKCDGKSYFYQFVLHPAIRVFFKARLAAWRGAVRAVQIVRMPMGWSFSPRTAQHVSNAVMSGLGLAWLDDFIIGGRSAEEFEQNRTEFRRRVTRYNIEVDDLELEPTTSLFRAVGLQFDLKDKRYRLDPDWVEKKIRPLRDSDLTSPRSFRSWFVVFGSLVWADYARGSPLWARAECLAAMSHLARTCDGDFDKLASLPAYALPNLRQWLTDAYENHWASPPPTRPNAPDHFIFSDASGHTSAWIRISHDLIFEGAQWATDDDRHIFLKELEAFLQATSKTAQLSGEKVYVLDNTAVNFANRRGHSSSYAANVMLRDALGKRRPWSMWTPTTLQLADPFTRGRIFSNPPTRLDHDELAALRSAQRQWDCELEAKTSCV
jgi:hypothetical protein